MPSIVVIRYRAGSGAALLRRMPASAGSYHYVPSVHVVEVWSAASS